MDKQTEFCIFVIPVMVKTPIQDSFLLQFLLGMCAAFEKLDASNLEEVIWVSWKNSNSNTIQMMDIHFVHVKVAV